MPAFTWLFQCPLISQFTNIFVSHKNRESKLQIEKHEKYEKVSAKFDSLDYEIIENDLKLSEELKHGLTLGFLLEIQRMITIILIALFTAISGVVVEIVPDILLHFKIHMLTDYINEHYNHVFYYPLIFLLLWASSIIPTMIGAAFVIFMEPTAAGGGIPGITAFLNGINVPRIVKLKVAFVKIVSVIFMLTASLAGGKEGPLIHIGVIMGATVPMMHLPFSNMRVFKLMQSDRERIDMASAGVAAGLTAAFSTPLGGFIMALEELVFFSTAETSARILYCGYVTSFFFVLLISSLWYDCIGCVYNRELLLLNVKNSEKNLEFYPFEILIFILIGIIGGITGTLWNLLEMEIAYYRAALFKTKLLKMFDVSILATITTLCAFLYIFTDAHCTSMDVDQLEREHFQMQMNCSKEEYATSGFFFFQGQTHLLRSFLSQPLIGVHQLFKYAIMYFILSAYTMSAPIACGIFIPNLILGAAWGRTLAEWTLWMYPQTKSWCNPSKYALLGAGSQLCGTTRICFSLGIIMLESSGVITFGLPIFTVLLTTKFVADSLSLPIYHADCSMKGMPLLNIKPPPFCSWIKLRSIMSTPVHTLPLIPKVDEVMDVLNKVNHNGFPVVDPKYTSEEDGITSFGQLRGFILRSQLLIILDRRLYRAQSGEIMMRTMRTQFASRIDLEQIRQLIFEQTARINLSTFMNISPMFVHMNTSLTNAYSLMSRLGIRHLTVVNRNNEVVGMVTRKDISVYRGHSTCCSVVSKIVPLVDRQINID